MPLPSDTSFKGVFVAGALGDGEFRAGELLVFGVDLAQCDFASADFDFVAGLVVVVLPCVGVVGVFQVDGVDVAGAADDRAAVESGRVGDGDRR